VRGEQQGHRCGATRANLKSADIIIDGGYGKLKGKTFRLSNMGDETPATMRELLAALDVCLA
jgi:aspartate aminotransferase-like enzyme